MTRVTGLLGIAWFGLFALGTIVLQGEPPASDQPVADTRELFAAHSDRYLLGDYLTGVAFIGLFLPFAAGLRRLLAAAEPGDDTLARLAFTGAVLMVLVGGTSTAFLDAVAINAGSERLDDSTVLALAGANSAAIALLGLPAALFTLTVAAAAWRSGPLPRPLALLGFSAGGLLVAGAAFPLHGGLGASLFAVRFLGFIAFALFVLLISISLVLRAEPSRSRDEGADDARA